MCAKGQDSARSSVKVRPPAWAVKRQTGKGVTVMTASLKVRPPGWAVKRQAGKGMTVMTASAKVRPPAWGRNVDGDDGPFGRGGAAARLGVKPMLSFSMLELLTHDGNDVGHDDLKPMRGFSMLELLVAVLVVGVGVLGVASLGVVNLQQARSAVSQAEVVRLAEDLTERIRANPAGLAAGAYAFGGGAAAAADCTGGPCTPTQMAAADLAAWLCALGASQQEECLSPISSAQGEVVVVEATGRFGIHITWRDAGGERTLRLRSAG